MHVATTKDALAWAAQRLTLAGIANARREAGWLLEHVLHVPAGALATVAGTPLNATQQAAFNTLIERRARREPLQYLLETVDFAGVTVRVTPAALIPRPETELLVDHAATAVNRAAPLQCADLGTGSGCIAIALATRLPHSHWWACDLSADALQLATANAQRNQCAERITFCCGDFWEALPPDLTFDLVTANPPYVADDTALEPELHYEPALALFSGADGLAAYRAIFTQLAARLKPGGVFVGEIGFDQAKAVAAVSRHAGLPAPEIFKDAGGHARVIFMRSQ
ncbi:MAG: peptide chain release factor N(5)-glutamine methyltransferase [bacterium]|nr:peptide chain release factor N(5)-glutamine methyltransferase [bacterium]